MRGGKVLKINMEFRRGILFVRLKGILNNKTSNLFTTKINHFVKENGIKYFTFNLEELDQLNQETIEIIRENYQQILQFNGRLVLCGVKDNSLSTIFPDVSQSELGVFQMIQV